MHPKMSLKEAESILGLKPHSITQKMKANHLPYTKSNNRNYFSHTAARFLYSEAMSIESFPSTVIATQIVKGGTGKTALTVNLSARLSLLGFKVLMVDLDQQANLTRYCNVNPEEHQTMIDVLEKGIPVQNIVLNASDGLDIIPSKIDNALLDDLILIKALPLNRAIKKHLNSLKTKYDFIIIDCPPSLGKSVGAAALSSDFIMCPVTPDEQCLSGLRLLHNGLDDLAEMADLKHPIPYRIVLNQYELRTIATNKMATSLDESKDYRKRLFKTTIKKNQEFKNKCDLKQSIYDSLSPSLAKIDIDFLCQEIIEFSRQIHCCSTEVIKKQQTQLV